MSSTELTLDQRDIHFALRECLPIEKLSESELFSEFDVDTVDMMVQEGIRFAIDVVSPTRTESDREGCRMEDGRVKVPKCLHDPYKKAYELGWATMRVSQEYGGMGAPATLGLVINEALNGANLGLSMFFGLTSGAAELIDTFGSAALKKKYAAKMFQGQYTGTMCLSEPQAGSDVGAGTTSAVSEGDGVYKIKGSKCWISSGDNDLGENVIHAVLARVKGAPDGTKGLSLFVVPYTRVNDDGTLGDWNDVTVASIENKLGIHASPTAVLNLGENDNCLGWIIGEEGQGISSMFLMMNGARIYTGLIGLALGGAAYENARAYAHERVQGTHISKIRDPDAPRVSIVNHPAVRLNLINMKAKVEAMRALLYYTSFQFDLEKIAKTDDEKQSTQNMVDMLTPMCKGWCTEVGLDVVRTGIQVLGGVGYTKDFPLEQLFRDARIAPIYEGTTDIQALDLVGRKMLQNGGILFQQLMEQFSQLIAEHSDHTELGGIIKSFEGYCESLYETSMASQEVLKTRGMEGVALYATPFLMFFSSVTAGWLMIKQAVVAAEKLGQIKTEQGIGELELSAFLEENEDALFYANKIKTTRYFVDGIIPQFDALLAGGKKQNYDALDITF
ncbi:MAG: acyl-CoA dehydrogenase [SAR324 cluster bacterium]|jgi:alkylation response protein AidB-like acyl-CoA dehydrogenase|nr:acyl-CoA dehydrogenase [SAR324 cluster bacterium]MCH2265468.1 acyl-CoA dehydrogenase [SAR324 cluster bacterium]